MSRLLVHVEGETEESFVNEVLGPHLFEFGFWEVAARLLGNARQRSRRGGICGWPSVRRDIVGHLKGDPTCIATTMVDYYGLPQAGASAWPGRTEASTTVFDRKASRVENAVLEDVRNEMGVNFDSRRFIPYLMMHEFEALLFSDCAKFASGIGQPELADRFQRIRGDFASPEEIDDSPNHAPSKRIETLVSGYPKKFMGL